ncbi:class D sortase [Minwuia thermotolerans]|nr:class D sortase [Minwuia thermotolerans]
MTGDRMSRRRWLTRSAVLASAIGGLWLAGEGAWMAAKAELGQVLLQRAWDGNRDAPWSGADMSPLARLTAPALGVETIVLDSASGEAMAWGPGHVRGTALPGAPGLAAIAGHRDSHLAFLGDLGPGSEVVIERGGETHRFRVTGAEVVDSRTWRFPAERDGRPRLALSTCWPLDAQTPGPLRLIVHAEAIRA